MASPKRKMPPRDTRPRRQAENAMPTGGMCLAATPRRPVPWPEVERMLDDQRRQLTKEPTLYDQRTSLAKTIDLKRGGLHHMEEEVSRRKDEIAADLSSLRDIDSRIREELDAARRQ